MTSRKGIRARLRRRKGSDKETGGRTDAQDRIARAEARQSAKREKPEGSKRSRGGRDRLRRHRGQLAELWIWIKGSMLEIRRRWRGGWQGVKRRLEPHAARVRKRLAPVGRAIAAVLRPVGAAAQAVLGPVAPYISGGLFLLVRGIGGLIALLLDSTLGAIRWTRARGGELLVWADREVTPIRVFGTIGAVAAVALGVSQFIDYSGIAVGADQYAGEVGTVADVPRVDVKTAGEVHAYILLPVAVLALVLVVLTMRGRWRLGLGVAVAGAIGIIVALAIDAPKGLDAGALGDAYAGTEGQLLEGFWTELISSIVLVACGVALGRAVYADGGGNGKTAGRQPEAAATTTSSSPSSSPPDDRGGTGHSPFSSGAGA